MEIYREIESFETICHSIDYNATQHSFHWHGNFELCLVNRGRCSFRINGMLVNAAPGDIVAIDSRAIHQFIIEEDRTNITILQFPIRLLLYFGGASSGIKMHITRGELARAGIAEKCDSLLTMLSSEKAARHSEDNGFTASLAAALFFILERNFPRSEDSEGAESKDKMLFFKITEYINSNVTGDINVTSLAGKLYFSRDKLSAVFRKYAGMSISDYVGGLKIKMVNKLLLEGHGITEAAMECGFTNIRTFNNLYKKHMQLTPSEFLHRATEANK